MDMNLHCGNHTTPVWTIGRVYTLGNFLGDQVKHNGLTNDDALRIVADELLDSSTVAGHAYSTLKQMVESGAENAMAWIGFLRAILRYYVPREFDPRTADSGLWRNVSTHYDRMFSLTSIIATNSVSKVVVSAHHDSVVYTAIEFGVTETPIATAAWFLDDRFIGSHGEVLSTDWSSFVDAVNGFRNQ